MGDRLFRTLLVEVRSAEVLVELRRRGIVAQAGFESLAGFVRMIEREIDVAELVVSIRIARIDLGRPAQTGEGFLVALLEGQQVAKLVLINGFFGSRSRGRLGMQEGCFVVAKLHFNSSQVPQS